MHPCPCCGYRTLPGRGDYDLCPVCSWEDDGGEPWELSGPNGTTLVEAQRAYLAQRRPHRLRPGRVRGPRRHEARDPDWRPIQPGPDLLARVQRAYDEQQRQLDEERRRTAREVADDPEGPFAPYNAALSTLRSRAGTLSHDEVRARVHDLGREHGVPLPEAYVELLSRLTKDERFYRRHPLHAVWWVLRFGRPGTFRRRWQEVRTGRFGVAG